MLINTVLVFLQNILPIFVVISVLFSQQAFNHQRTEDLTPIPLITFRHAINIVILGLISVFVLSQYMETVSQLFSGSGVEILFSLLFCLIYCLIFAEFLSNGILYSKHKHTARTGTSSVLINQHRKLGFTIFFLILCIHGSYFSMYIMSLSFQEATFDVLTSGIIVGIIIGTGISLSIAILLYFTLRAFERKTGINITRYCLLFFGVGQLMQAIQLLEQVDIISSNAPLWNTNSFIAENSELGYFFTMLFGYEATPSFIQLTFYLTAVIVPIIITHFISFKQQYDKTPLIQGTY